MFNTSYDDVEFEDFKITNVKEWVITLDNGWSYFLPETSPIIPKIGMNARFYGKGIGYAVRGLFLDGIKVFYRTTKEQEDYMNKELYGSDVNEWLKRWDSGKGVWSIEMGGLGPGYEQSIQITVAEILRYLLANSYNPENKETRKEFWSTLETESYNNDIFKKLGLSGAQWGAACHLAARLYRDGPIAVMTDEEVKDRHIQVSKNFPKV